MQEQIGNASRHMEILRKNQKEMLQIKTKTLKEMKNIFNGLLSRPNTAEETISELEDISKKCLKKKSREEKTG